MYERYVEHVFPLAASVLPHRMDSIDAWRMVAAICLQESRFEYRRQIHGPAKGWAQFERIGVEDVCIHAATRRPLRHALRQLSYIKLADRLDDDDEYKREEAYTQLHGYLESSDVLAIVVARLALWKLPDYLPSGAQPHKGWAQYLEVWRPGKEKPHTWVACWKAADAATAKHLMRA